MRPRGLTVTAPVMFGELFLIPLIAEYLDLYPEVEINALLVDRVVNMVEEGVDVAVRIGSLREGEHLALQVGQIRPVVCAAPSLLDRIGRPSRPEDLENAQVVMSSASGLLTHWQFMGPDGRSGSRRRHACWSAPTRRRSRPRAWAGASPACCRTRWPRPSPRVNWRRCSTPSPCPRCRCTSSSRGPARVGQGAYLRRPLRYALPRRCRLARGGGAGRAMSRHREMQVFLAVARGQPGGARAACNCPRPP